MPKKIQPIVKPPCEGCARNKENKPDRDNSICVNCSRLPNSERPDNWMTLEAYRNLVMKGLYGT